MNGGNECSKVIEDPKSTTKAHLHLVNLTTRGTYEGDAGLILVPKNRTFTLISKCDRSFVSSNENGIFNAAVSPASLYFLVVIPPNKFFNLKTHLAFVKF